jgi:hypothetical protein
LLLILIALALAVFGLVRVGRPLEPKQRVVLVIVFIIAVVWLILTLVRLGVLGHVSPPE